MKNVSVKRTQAADIDPDPKMSAKDKAKKYPVRLVVRDDLDDATIADVVLTAREADFIASHFYRILERI